MLKRNDPALFDLLAYFEGETHADGVFEDRSGREKRRFAVRLKGERTGSTLVLTEDFSFDDGETQQRSWTLTPKGPERFAGRCEDSVSQADGRLADGRAYLRSELRLKVGTRQIAMRFDDVFYDLGAGLVLNRSTVTKWGIRIGQVLILFRKG